MSDTLTIAVGATVTSGYTLPRGDRPFAIGIPRSMNGSDVRVEFAPTLTGLYDGLMRTDGSGLPFSIHPGNGPAWCVIPTVPTKYLRITTITTQTSARALTIQEMNRP